MLPTSPSTLAMSFPPKLGNAHRFVNSQMYVAVLIVLVNASLLHSLSRASSMLRSGGYQPRILYKMAGNMLFLVHTPRRDFGERCCPTLTRLQILMLMLILMHAPWVHVQFQEIVSKFLRICWPGREWKRNPRLGLQGKGKGQCRQERKQMWRGVAHPFRSFWHHGLCGWCQWYWWYGWYGCSPQIVHVQFHTFSITHAPSYWAHFCILHP